MAVPGPAFELQDVALLRGRRRVLQGVSLRIAAGERVALVGPSGAGKTSLLRLLSAGLAAQAGRTLVLGEDPRTLGERALRRLRARIGFVHQDLALVPNLRVHQNVASGRLGSQGLIASLRSFLWPPQAELEEVHSLLERVGIEEHLFDRTDRLSGGEQQRVALARALHQRPAVLLADEPVASLDPPRSREVLGLLARLAEEEGLACVVSLHQPERARSSFPRWIGLQEGRVLFDRPAEEVGEGELEELYHSAEGGGA